MNVEVTVTVILQVETDENVPESEVIAACSEAITNSVERSVDNGFTHRLEDCISIGLVEVTTED